ncbi:adenylyl cyclase [Intrasporangium mesophilum]
MTTASRIARPFFSTHPRRRRAGQALLAIVLALIGGLALVAPGSAVAAPPPAPDLGPNVVVFDPSMSVAQIKASADAIYNQQVDNEMGSGRYTLLFKPGTYGTAQDPLMLRVGYYTEVAGLGALPTDVVINGHVDVYNRCLAPDNCVALVNFWRSLSNLTINVMGETGCRGSGNFWAVSQAAPMRRVNIVGNLTLMDYCTAGPQYASGGFIADSRLNSVVNGSQQQFLVRNGSIGSWSNAVWNQVFSGVVGAPPTTFPNPQYTNLATTPVSRERPFLFIDSTGRWQVRVPSAASDTSDVTWASGQTPGRTIPLSDFYIARPTDSVATINSQLARGKHLLLTPGVYTADRSISVKRANTVVLAMGLASITASGGAVPLVIADVPGVIVAGLIVDAGPVSSPALIRVGSRHPQDEPVLTPASNPTTLQDVFLRVGGPFAGRATVGLEVNLDHTLLDDIWAWRADHGNGVGWTVNPAENGVVVNGDDVTATGLFSEHFRQYDTVWNGERGRTVFYQNEMPYDPPNQAAWQHDGVLGWAGYKVGDRVRTHELWGGGVYIFTNVDPTIHASRGFEVPVTPGVRLHDIITVNLSAGTIDHVVNDTGDPVSNAAIGVPSYVVSYP